MSQRMRFAAAGRATAARLQGCSALGASFAVSDKSLWIACRDREIRRVNRPGVIRTTTAKPAGGQCIKSIPLPGAAWFNRQGS